MLVDHPILLMRMLQILLPLARRHSLPFLVPMVAELTWTVKQSKVTTIACLRPMVQYLRPMVVPTSQLITIM